MAHFREIQRDSLTHVLLNESSQQIVPGVPWIARVGGHDDAKGCSAAAVNCLAAMVLIIPLLIGEVRFAPIAQP
eukprot:4743352-Pyramimonas_sp.AAC.1